MNLITIKEERLKKLTDELIPILEGCKRNEGEQEENYEVPKATLMLENGKIIAFIDEDEFRIALTDNKYLVSLYNNKLYISRKYPYKRGHIDLSDKRASKIINIIRKFFDEVVKE